MQKAVLEKWKFPLNKRDRNSKGHSKMDNPETLETLSTQDTGRRQQQKRTTQKAKKMSKTGEKSGAHKG